MWVSECVEASERDIDLSRTGAVKTGANSAENATSYATTAIRRAHVWAEDSSRLVRRFSLCRDSLFEEKSASTLRRECRPFGG